MKVFSILLRILSLGACGFAVFSWIDKKDLIAQKEAVIQQREFLTGYKIQRKALSEVTQEDSTRNLNFAKIKARGGSDSLKGLEAMESSLKEIQGRDEFFGHKGKDLGGDDPAKQLTYKSHIAEQAQKITTQISTIASRDETIEEITKDRDEKNTLLGEEITKNGDLTKEIEGLNATIVDKDNKFEQLKGNYNDDKIKHQQDMAQLKKDLATEKEALALQLADKEAKISELETKVREEEMNVQRLLAAQQRAMGVVPGGAPIGAVPPTGAPAIPGATPQPGAPGGSSLFALQAQPLRKNAQFIGFNAKTKMMAVQVGENHGVKKGMKLKLQRNGSLLSPLGIVKVEAEYSIFQVLQNPDSEEWKTISSLRKGDVVTVAQ